MSGFTRRQFLSQSMLAPLVVASGRRGHANELPKPVKLEGAGDRDYTGFGSFTTDLKMCGWFVSSEKVTKIWDARTGKLLAKLEGKGEMAKAVAFSPDGKLLALAYDKPVIWDWAAGEIVHTLPRSSDTCEELAFSPDGKLLIVPAGNTIPLYDLATGKERFKFAFRPRSEDDGGGECWCCDFAPDGNSVAVGTWGGRVFVIAVPEGKLLHTLAVKTRVVRSVRWSTDGKTIVGGCHYSGGIVFWDGATGKEQFVLPVEAKTPNTAIGRLAMAPDGKTIAAGLLDGSSFDIWDVGTRKVRQRVRRSGRIRELAFSKEGGPLFDISGDKTSVVDSSNPSQ